MQESVSTTQYFLKLLKKKAFNAELNHATQKYSNGPQGEKSTHENNTITLEE